MTTTRPWPARLPWLFVAGGCALAGCLREPDPGGQEGEEIRPTGVADEGTDGDEELESGDEGDDGDVAVDHISGQRRHLRGGGERGDYDCELYWSMQGDAGADGCPECIYTFSVTFGLDPVASDRDGYACDDVYSDQTATVGLMEDYYGHGPAVVGMYEEAVHPYFLGFAWIDGNEVGWSYGYIDEAWWDDGTYYTWIFEVTATLE